MILTTEAEQKLGLTIPGEEVRLITGVDDPYRWSGLPGTEHLFTKQLSKHCLRSYIEIYNGVGNSFEALPNDTVDKNELSSTITLKRAVSPSFTSQSVKVSLLIYCKSRLTLDRNHDYSHHLKVSAVRSGCWRRIIKQ